MKALVIIHTEMGYLDPEEFDQKQRIKIKTVFESIARAIPKYRKEGRILYYLPEDMTSLAEGVIYPDIMQNIEDALYLPSLRTTEDQFLRTKESLLRRKIEAVDLAGLSYHSCLLDLHSILTGEVNDENFMDDLENARLGLNWSQEKYQEIMGAKLNSRIAKELTSC